MMAYPQYGNIAENTLLTPHDTNTIDVCISSLLGQIMDNAGLMVARTIRQFFHPCRVLVACGSGNNGGDGYVAARYLQAWGWPVVVAPWKPPRVGGLAFYAAQKWEGVTVPFTAQEAQRADLVIDAVFGAGLSKQLPEEVEFFFQHVRSCVAIDLPSGVFGATGVCQGKVAQNCLTVALDRKRPAHLLSPSAGKCGNIVCVDIGIPRHAYDNIKVTCWENTPSLWPLPQQHQHDHKYTRGVVCVCGGHHMPGAAYLASESARRSGAGLVRVLASTSTAVSYRSASPGVVVDSVSVAEALQDKRRHVWVCGPGLVKDEVEQMMPLLLQAQCCVVADAGVFAWAEGQVEKLKGVQVMTPHLGEFERVFGSIKDSRIEAIRRAAQKSGSVVVLKGADTLIAAPDGRVAINTHATPALATAGSGDVLSGIIATMLAADMPAWEASCAGVWLHGEAGRQAVQEHGRWIIAENLLQYLGKSRFFAENQQKEEGKN